MNWFQRFKLAWKMAQLPEYELLADDPNFWTGDDARATAIFFNSHTGGKLKRLLNNFVFRTCYQSCAQTGDHAYHSGVARGVSLTVFELQEKFSRVPAQEDETEDDPDHAAFKAILEDYAAN